MALVNVGSIVLVRVGSEGATQTRYEAEQPTGWRELCWERGHVEILLLDGLPPNVALLRVTAATAVACGEDWAYLGPGIWYAVAGAAEARHEDISALGSGALPGPGAAPEEGGLSDETCDTEWVPSFGAPLFP